MVFFVGVFCLISTSGGAQPVFPSQYLPDGARPRLWITPDHLSTLQAARTANTVEWQEFKDYVDREVMTTIDWRGPQEVVAAMALMHLLTGEQRYADRAVDVMVNHVRSTPENNNDAGHGLYGYLGLGYDWLYDNPAMTTEVKAALTSKMIGWSASVWQEQNDRGFASNTDTDEFIMTGAAHLMMGCAIYGDAPEARTLLDRAWWLWSRGSGRLVEDDPRRENIAQSGPELIRNALGGHFYTGMSYFTGTDSIGLSQNYLSLRTACGYDVNVQEPDLAPFWANTIRTTLDLTYPDRLSLHHTGDWQDENQIYEVAYLASFLKRAAFHAEQAGYSDWASYARGYAQKIAPRSNFPFTEFFFSNSSGAVVDPYQANLPTVRFCNGTDILFFRDSWETSATWGMFSGQGGEPADHQQADTGNFVLWREDDFLTKDARIYGPLDMSIAFNCLSIQNGLERGSPRMFDGDGKASLARRRIQNQEPLFAYAMMEGDDQWNESVYRWEPTLRVQTYRRHFFWSGDYAVVFDRLRTVDSGWCKYRLRCLSAPTQFQGTIETLSENGKHKLLHRTLEPSNATFTLIDEKQAWAGVLEDYIINESERRWQYEIQPPDSDRVNFLNVMQMGPASMNGFDPLEHITGGGNSGARIGDWVLVFADEETSRTSVQYQIASPTAPMHHLVCDLASGTYEVAVNGVVLAAQKVNDSDNTAYFVTNSAAGPMTVTLRQTGATAKAGRWILY